MAEVVDAMPTQRRGGGSLYQWDKWFDGQAWKLRKGEDFKLVVNNFRSAALTNAKRRGLKLRTTVVGDCLFLQVTGKLKGAKP